MLGTRDFSTVLLYSNFLSSNLVSFLPLWLELLLLLPRQELVRASRHILLDPVLVSLNQSQMCPDNHEALAPLEGALWES